MTEILNIGGEPVFDDRIVKIETHTYNPYANTTFEYSDEIRIPIQQQDLYTLPCESFLYVEGTLTVTRAAGQADDVVLGNNCVAFMFDEIRYELDGVEIDHCRNVGITSTLKNYVTVSSDRSVILQNAGWEPHNNANGYFNFCVPLNLLLGFCENYKRVVINAHHKLILIRSRTDNNCLMGSLGHAYRPTPEDERLADELVFGVAEIVHIAGSPPPPPVNRPGRQNPREALAAALRRMSVGRGHGAPPRQN
ncbi:uncharacterized protein LOC143902125 [Temnothorax americanus]|uniref:uncharacterized protein LOC143902125 n=1 Tax=Temnothorax americanus TaxID=1964332 RepID=UPI00406788DA